MHILNSRREAELATAETALNSLAESLTRELCIIPRVLRKPFLRSILVYHRKENSFRLGYRVQYMIDSYGSAPSLDRSQALMSLKESSDLYDILA